MEITALPDELFKMVISYLSKSDAKNMALCSKWFHKMSLDKIWNYPQFKKIISLKFAKESTHLPIQEIHTSLFNFNIFDENCWGFLKGIQILYINQYYEISLQDLKKLPISDIELVIYTKSVNLETNEDFESLLEMSKTHKIRALILDHHHGQKLDEVHHGNHGVSVSTKKYNNLKRWSLKELEMVSNVFGIYQLSTDCLDLRAGTFDEFIDFIASKLSSTLISLDRLVTQKDDFKFTVAHLDQMVSQGLKITSISTSILNVRDIFLIPLPFDGFEIQFAGQSTLDEYVPTFKKMKHLKALDWDLNHNDQKTKMSLYVDLPITRLNIQHFDIKNGKLPEAVEIIREMKFLMALSIGCSNDEPEKFSPEEFALFEGLPVNNVNLKAIDLSTKENVEKVKEVMMKMKIISMYEIGHHHKFGDVPLYTISNHGPGGRYYCIDLLK
uniref:F-box domain-containing protein n=1 Tax=Clytia hemisphaerica TaxID=252671 RepID=A0A7M5V965_9CNID